MLFELSLSDQDYRLHRYWWQNAGHWHTALAPVVNVADVNLQWITYSSGQIPNSQRQEADACA